jgi:hypothetical protein
LPCKPAISESRKPQRSMISAGRAKLEPISCRWVMM